MYIVNWVSLVVDQRTLLVGGCWKLWRHGRRCLPCVMNVTLTDSYHVQQRQNCHRMMEGCVPLCFSYRHMERHMFCLLVVMALQSKARGQWCATVAAKTVTPFFDTFAEIANAGIKGTVRFTGVFRDVPADRRIPDYYVHGVFRVCNCAFSGTVGVLMARGGMSRGNVARLVQRVVHGAREAIEMGMLEGHAGGNHSVHLQLSNGGLRVQSKGGGRGVATGNL